MVLIEIKREKEKKVFMLETTIKKGLEDEERLCMISQAYPPKLFYFVKWKWRSVVT